MDKEAIKKHRIARLQALIDDRFDKEPAELARALKLENAAFLRQMLSGLRPVSEKTIAKLEAVKPGLVGWFGLQVMTASGEPLVLTQDELDVVMGMRAAKAAREGAKGGNVATLTPSTSSGAMRSQTNPGAQQAKPAAKRKRGA